MVSIKILHIADLHLDSKIENLGSRKSSQRRTEILLSLRNVLSRFSDAKIVLIAGDLFDGLYNRSTINYLCKLFSDYAESRFFISAGNHDSLSSEPMIKFVENIPKNVHVFGESVSCVTVGELGINVYGASFSSPSLYSSFLNGFHAENNDMVKGMQESLDSLKRQIEETDREKKNWEDKLAQMGIVFKKIPRDISRL